MKNGTLIITAAGNSTRFGKKNKCLEKINDKTVLENTIDQFINFDWNEVIITCNRNSQDSYEQIIQLYQQEFKLVIGGKTRFESVKNAVLSSCDKSDYIIVHDAARPFVSKSLIERIINSDASNSVIPGIPVVDTVKEISKEGVVIRTPQRSSLRAIQTPQCFKKKLLIECYKKNYSIEITDEAMLFELNNLDIQVIEGDTANKKITFLNDLESI